MRKSVVAPLVVAAAILIQGLALAATPHKELPPEIAGHVSVRSLRGFIRNLDRYIAAASKDSENEIPSGFLSMMAMIYLPVPMDDWESDGPVNMVVLDAPTTREMPYVFFFQAPDFDRLVETIAEGGLAVGDEMSSGNYKKVRPITIPKNQTKYLVDMEDGRVAVADKVSDLDVIKNSDWFPTHMSEADLRANLTLKNKDNPLTKIGRDLIAQKKNGIIEKIGDVGLKPAFAQGVGQLLEKYGPELAAQMDNVRSLLVELRFVDGIANLDLGAKFEPGSLGDEIAVNMEKSGKLNLALADRVPPGAFSVAVSYPATSILPDAPARVGALVGDVAGMLAPGIKDKLVAYIKELYAAKPGQAVSANYVKGDRNYSLSYLPTDEPEKMLGAFTKLVESLYDGWNEIIVDADHGIILNPSERSVDGQPVYHFAYQLKNPEKFQELLDRMNAMQPDLDLRNNDIGDFSLYLTRGDKGVLMAAGDVEEAEFLDAAKRMRQPEPEGMFHNPSAEKLLSHVENGQGSIGMMDPLGLFNIYMNASAQAYDSRFGQPESNPYRIAMNAFNATPREAKNVIAFSFGADKGWFLSRALIPSAAVNEVARAYDEYTKVRKESAQDLNVPDDAQEPDFYEDDFEEEDFDEQAGDEEAA